MTAPRSVLRVEQFAYTRLGERLALVRLLAEIADELRLPVEGSLTVRCKDEWSSHPARACRTSTTSLELLWRASFAVPLEVVEYPDALFEFTAPGFAALVLPAPELRLNVLPSPEEIRSGLIPPTYLLKRLAAVATVLTVSATYNPVLAVAAGGGSHQEAALGKQAAITRQKIEAKLTVQGSRPQQKILPAPAPHPFSPTGVHISKPASHRSEAPAPSQTGPRHLLFPIAHPRHEWIKPHHHDHHLQPGHAQLPPAAPAHHRHTTLPSGGAPATSPFRTGPAVPQPAATPTSVTHGAHRGVSRSSHTNPAIPRTKSHAVVPLNPGTEMLGNLPAKPAIGTVGDLPATPWQLSHMSTLLSSGDQPPSFLIPIYKAAGRRYEVPWKILAAINSIETSYGRNLSTSSAGAIGWMQFMPGTWSTYGVSADGQGNPDPYDPRDAIFSAANYLAANGASQDIRKAIFAYNHADWYVNEVLLTAQTINGGSGVAPSATAGERVQAMVAMADLLLGKPYVWGGGHSGWQIEAGYDCSGFVSAVLHAGGYLSSPQTTETLPSQPGIEPGPGSYVTIFDRTGSGGQGHVIIDLNGQFYESGGSAAAGGGAGVKKLVRPPAQYLGSFNTILHPTGL